MEKWGDYSTIEDIIVKYSGSPEKPDIDGPKEGKPGIEYNYTFVSTDPEGEDLFYYIDWGDGTFEDWIGPYQSGETVTMSHEWKGFGEKTLDIRVKVKDVHDVISNWSAPLQISLPKHITNPWIKLLYMIIERFPLLQNFSFFYFLL